MNNLFTVFILCLCVFSTYGATLENGEKKSMIKSETLVFGKQQVSGNETKSLMEKLSDLKDEIFDMVMPKSNETLSRNKRQYLPQPQPQRLANQIMDGGAGVDYPDVYDVYPNDFLYDYYDWVCSDTACQLCNILTSECCDPDVNVNCFLPDSCLNNPCLSGGTCIPTRTIDNRPDFICACYPGFTGKYCQLTNEFFFPPPPPPPPPVQPYVPQPPYVPPPPVYPVQRPQYQPPQPPAYVPQQPAYVPQQPSYVPQQPPQQVRQPVQSYGQPAQQAPSYGPQPPQPQQQQQGAYGAPANLQNSRPFGPGPIGPGPLGPLPVGPNGQLPVPGSMNGQGPQADPRFQPINVPRV